jgi:hypothetical protein
MLTDEFLYQRLRELTRQYLVAPPEPIHLYFGEPSDPAFHEFELSILETDQDAQGPYWQVLTSIMCQRPKGQIGSVYQPLCCSSLVWASGKVEYGGMGNGAISEAYVAF